MHNLKSVATCTSFLKILQYSSGEWLNHLLTPFQCVHNPERIHQFREHAMWMFQPTIDFNALRTTLPAEQKMLLLILSVLHKFYRQTKQSEIMTRDTVPYCYKMLYLGHFQQRQPRWGLRADNLLGGSQSD